MDLPEERGLAGLSVLRGRSLTGTPGTPLVIGVSFAGMNVLRLDAFNPVTGRGKATDRAEEGMAGY